MRLIPPCFALLLFLPDLGAQSHLTAPSSSFPTIQSAIDVALDGDVIDVPAGVYSEALDLRGRQITIVSIDGPGSTFFSGPQQKIRARSGETRSTRIEGFTFTGTLGGAWPSVEVLSSGLTLRNCRFDSITMNLPASLSANFGAAISSTNSDLVVESCSFENCQAADAADSNASILPVAGASGGALVVRGGSLAMDGCQFLGNRAGRGGSDLGQSSLFNMGTAGGQGGAMALSGVVAVIRNSLFDGNRAGSGGMDLAPSPVFKNGIGGDGGAIFCEPMAGSQASLFLERCFFLDNETGRQLMAAMDLEGSGGAIAARNVDLDIRRCFFCGNGANLGAALAQRSDASLGLGSFDLSNSIFLGNSASGFGGACYLQGSYDADLLHNVMIGNGAALGAACFFENALPNSVHVSHSIVQSSWGPDFDSSEGPSVPSAEFNYNLSDQPMPPGLGNLVGNAGFIDAANLNFRLRPESICVDAGAVSGDSVMTDWDGEARPFGRASDIGADEYVGLSPVATGTVTDGMGQSVSVLNMNGEDGGATRYVVLPVGSQTVWSMDSLPLAANPDHFILWGRIGLPLYEESYLLRFLGAELCFTPHLEDLGNPLLFTFANSFQPVGSGLVSAYPAPFVFPSIALNFPITITVQGLILDDAMQFEVTNALAVELR